MLWKLAWQFAKRQWARNLLVGGAVAVSVFVMVFLGGLMVGIRDQFQQRVIEQSGHLRLHASGWSRQTDALVLEPAIAHPEAVLARLRSIRGVSQAEALLPFGALAAHGSASLYIEIDGVDPDGFSTRLARRGIRSGSFHLGDNGLVLSKGTARVLGVQVGDPATLLVEDASDMPYYREFSVAGVFDTGSAAVDDSHAYISLAAAGALTGLDTSVMEIRVLTDTPSRVDPLRRTILQEFPAGSLEVETWNESQGSFLVFFRLFDVFMGGINVFLSLVAVMVITNTLLMNFFERLPSVATLRAIGMHRGGAWGLSIREGVILGGLGTAAGAIVGALAMAGLGGGLDLGETGAALGMGTKLPFRLDFVVVAEALAAGLATVLAAALYAGWTGSKTAILEALKET